MNTSEVDTLLVRVWAKAVEIEPTLSPEWSETFLADVAWTLASLKHEFEVLKSEL